MMLTPIASHDKKNHATPNFNCLDLWITMVTLIMLLASHDVHFSANGVKWPKNSCSTAFQIDRPKDREKDGHFSYLLRWIWSSLHDSFTQKMVFKSLFNSDTGESPRRQSSSNWSNFTQRMVLTGPFNSGTGEDSVLHIHCSGFLVDKAAAGRQSSMIQYRCTWKMILKRPFVNDTGEALYIHLGFLADRTWAGRQSFISQKSCYQKMVLKRLFIGSTWKANSACSLLGLLGNRAQWVNTIGLLRRWSQKGNSFVTLGKALLCVFFVQVSQEIELFDWMCWHCKVWFWIISTFGGYGGLERTAFCQF